MSYTNSPQPYAEHTSEKIASFTGPYRFLSNFFPARVTYKGVTYLNAEAAYQAQKCRNPADKYQFKNLFPSKAKSLGKQVPLKEDWKEICRDETKGVVLSKFSQNPELREQPLETGNIPLIEKNHWGDTFWGVNLQGKGTNNLEKILMEVREELRSSR